MFYMNYTMIVFVYKWLPIIFGCHCRDDRSFHYKGRRFPICARCTGELAGIVGSIIMFWFWRPNVIASLIMLFPLILDGFVQALTKYESTNARRLLTGILFGIGLASLFAESTIIAFEYGIEIGRTLKK